MVKLHMWSTVDPWEDEDGKQWDASVSVSLDEWQYIDIEAAFPSAALAEKWCSDLQATLQGCFVTLQDMRETHAVEAVVSTYPLLNRPPNPALDIIRERH